MSLPRSPQSVPTQLRLVDVPSEPKPRRTQHCSVCGLAGHNKNRHDPTYKNPRAGEVRHCSICGGARHNKVIHREVTGKRVCPCCKKELDLDQFQTRNVKTRPDGSVDTLAAYCIECNRVKSATRYRGSFHDRFGYRLATIRHKCRKDGTVCTIDVQFLEQQYERQGGLCYFSGRPLSLNTGDQAVSIDRIDPTGGYCDSNVVLTLWIVNHMKRRTSAQDFIALCRDIGERGAERSALH